MQSRRCGLVCHILGGACNFYQRTQCHMYVHIDGIWEQWYAVRIKFRRNHISFAPCWAFSSNFHKVRGQDSDFCTVALLFRAVVGDVIWMAPVTVLWLLLCSTRIEKAQYNQVSCPILSCKGDCASVARMFGWTFKSDVCAVYTILPIELLCCFATGSWCCVHTMERYWVRMSTHGRCWNP